MLAALFEAPAVTSSSPTLLSGREALPECLVLGLPRAINEKWGSPELVDTFAKLRRERRGVEWAKDVVILRMSSSEKRWPCW